MWPSISHILKPLTDKSGLKNGQKLDWTDKMRAAFDKMKLLLAADALATRFDMYNDDSDYQVLAFAKTDVLLHVLVRSCLNNSKIILQ
jgi:hypothetical protein